MARRKYAVEIALQLSSTHWGLFQGEGFKASELHATAVGASFNVYAILERPRLKINPKTLAASCANTIGGSFEVCGRQPETHDFELTTEFDLSGLTIDSPYPHTSIRILEGAEEVALIKLPLAAPWIKTAYAAITHYNVSYVGQAQGDVRDRDAMQRLSNHETLQAIMLDVIRERPDNDIWLFVADFEASTMWQMGQSSLAATATEEESLSHIARVESEICKDREQLVNVAEAALIRHFKPTYNERYKKTFPSPKHSTYTAAYETDINALIVTLATGHNGAVQLGSEAVSPSSAHICRFPLHKKTLREYMFDLFGVDK